VTITVPGPIQPGKQVEVVAEWPHGYVAGQPQPWQRALDAKAAQTTKDQQFRASWGPVFTLGFASLGILVAVGGLLLLYLWWYRRGRDAPVGLVADYLPEPPSDLPAGVAGTLVDESADVQDILASILDLPGAAPWRSKRRTARLHGYRNQGRLHLPEEGYVGADA